MNPNLSSGLRTLAGSNLFITNLKFMSDSPFKKIYPVFLALMPFLLAAQADVAGFDRYVEQARQQWKAPGMAVAIVKDGKVLLAKGYGLRSLAGKEPVDEKTLFAICSTTKAMTAAAMGMLVDEKKVGWDDPVSQYLPEFLLHDPLATRALRIRDLFTHNAGLGNADFLWYNNDLGPDEILHRMRYARPAYAFRGGFTYQNIMYLAAGKVIEKVAGMPWEQFMTGRIFQPLGMTRTFPTRAASLGEANRSTPHYTIGGEIRPIRDSDADLIAPAGAVWSCVEDMAKWTRFVLAKGVVDGKRLISESVFDELLRPQTIVSQDQFYPTTALTRPHWLTYALGWFQHDYNGQFLSFHTGSLAGTTAIIGILPEADLGIYIFGNLDHAEVRHALMYKALDVFGPVKGTRDWSSEMLALYTQIQQSADETRAKAMTRPPGDAKPGLPLEAYTGRYEDPFFGTCTVSLREGRLRLQISSKLFADLEPWQSDNFKATWSEPWMAESLVGFRTNPERSKVESVTSGRQVYKKL